MGRRAAKVNLPKKHHFRATIEKTTILRLSSVVEVDVFLTGDESPVGRARKIRQAIKAQLQREAGVGIERQWLTEKMDEKSEFEVRPSSLQEDIDHITPVDIDA